MNDSCTRRIAGPVLFLFAALVSLPAQQGARQIESRALALERRGDAQGALASWRKAGSLEPGSATVEDHIGFLLAVLGRRGEAIPHFDRALELDPQFASAHYHLGVAYWLERDADRGIPQLEAAAQIAPARFDYRFYLGQAWNDT